MEALFVIVDEDAGGDVHCVHEAETFPHATGKNLVAYILRDVDERSTFGYVEFEVLGVGFHGSSFWKRNQGTSIIGKEGFIVRSSAKMAGYRDKNRRS